MFSSETKDDLQTIADASVRIGGRVYASFESAMDSFFEKAKDTGDGVSQVFAAVDAPASSPVEGHIKAADALRLLKRHQTMLDRQVDDPKGAIEYVDKEEEFYYLHELLVQDTDDSRVTYLQTVHDSSPLVLTGLTVWVKEKLQDMINSGSRGGIFVYARVADVCAIENAIEKAVADFEVSDLEGRFVAFCGQYETSA